jgi:hypothetical protein
MTNPRGAKKRSVFEGERECRRMHRQNNYAAPDASRQCRTPSPALFLECFAMLRASLAVLVVGDG